MKTIKIILLILVTISTLLATYAGKQAIDAYFEIQIQEYYGGCHQVLIEE